VYCTKNAFLYFRLSYFDHSKLPFIIFKRKWCSQVGAKIYYYVDRKIVTGTLWLKCYVKWSIIFSSYPLRLPKSWMIVVPCPLDKMSINTTLIRSARYCIYIKLGMGWKSDIEKLVIVKLPFDRRILQFCQFVNRLRHALYNEDNPKYLCWKWFFITLGKPELLFCYPHYFTNFKFHSPWRCLTQRLFILCQRV